MKNLKYSISICMSKNTNIYTTCWVYIQSHSCKKYVCTPKIKPMGWSNDWAHNLFVLWALDFLQWVVPDSETQMQALVSLIPLLFLVSLSLLTATPLWSPPPLSSSHSPPINSSRWVGKSWSFLIVSGNGGPMSLSLSGCSVGSRSGIGTGSHLKEPFGSDIP